MTLLSRVATVGCQVLGTASVLVALTLLVGVPWTLLVAGVLMVVGSTAFEAQALGRPARPSDRRSAPRKPGVE